MDMLGGPHGAWLTGLGGLGRILDWIGLVTVNLGKMDASEVDFDPRTPRVTALCTCCCDAGRPIKIRIRAE